MSNYACITTKLKAMQKHLLKDDDYEQLINLRSLHELVDFLKSNQIYAPYFDNINPAMIHRDEIEAILYEAFNDDFNRIYKFASLETRQYLKSYAKSFVILFIKKAMHQLHSDNISSLHEKSLQDFFRKYSDIDPNEVMKASTTGEFIEALKSCELYDGLKEIYNNTGDTQVYFETYLDAYFFKSMWSQKSKNLSSTDSIYIKKVYGTTMDLVNIMTIYRSKKFYHLQDSNIIPFLMPINYKLTTDDVNALMHTSDLRGFLELLATTPYAEMVEEINTRPIGAIANDIISRMSRKMLQQNTYSYASIGTYLLMRGQEILYLISITEGIRYQIGSKELSKFIGRR